MTSTPDGQALNVGAWFTVTADVANEVQPVLVCINVKVAIPPDTPVTIPASVTVATDVLLLVHVPPVVGDKVVVVPTHIAVDPVMLTIGKLLTVTTALPVIVSVQPPVTLVATTVKVAATI